MFHNYFKEYVQYVVLLHEIALAMVQLSLLLLLNAFCLLEPDRQKCVREVELNFFYVFPH